MSVGNGPNRIRVKRSTAALAADPSKLAVQSTGAGWLLLFLEDGEATPIGGRSAVLATLRSEVSRGPAGHSTDGLGSCE